MTLLSVTLVLFFIIDPLGNVASFLKVLEGVTVRQRRWIIIREMFIALGVMLGINFLGDAIIGLLTLSETSVRLSAGLILFIVAVTILFPSVRSLRPSLRPQPDAFVVPLAIPLTAGPSLIAAIMLYARLDPTGTLMLQAIFIAWGAAAVLLTLSTELMRYLGKNGLLACERLTGMVLVMLAIQQFLMGIQLFVRSYPAIQ